MFDSYRDFTGPVSEDVKVGDIAHSNHHHTRRWHRFAIGIVAFIGVLVLLRVFWTESSQAQSCTCGTSPDDAISRGCKFDPFALSWLPNHCRDDELIDRFSAVGKEQNHTWDFFTFPNATEALDVGQVSMLAGDEYESAGLVITTLDWHNTHCLYILVQLAQQQHTGKLLAPRYREQGHIDHCIDALMYWVTQLENASESSGVSEVDLYSK